MSEFMTKLGRPEGWSALKYWISTHKPLPKNFGINTYEGDMSSVEQHDGDWKVGSLYVRPDGYACRVLTHELIFLGYTSIVEFANGATRRVGPGYVMYKVVET